MTLPVLLVNTSATISVLIVMQIARNVILRVAYHVILGNICIMHNVSQTAQQPPTFTIESVPLVLPIVMSALMLILVLIVELLPLYCIMGNAIALVPRVHILVVVHVLSVHHHASNVHQVVSVLHVIPVSCFIIMSAQQLALLVTGITMVFVLVVKLIVLNASLRLLVVDVILQLSYIIMSANLHVLLELHHQMESVRVVQMDAKYVHLPLIVVIVIVGCSGYKNHRQWLIVQVVVQQVMSHWAHNV